MKKLLIRIRTTLKFLILVGIATVLIVGAVAIIYKPIYSVYLNNELIGYCKEKSKLQNRISEYIENGNNDNENLAFVSIDKMPKYKLCLLKRGIATNDDEIFEKVKLTGQGYYKYFAILEEEEEKAYVSKFEDAEKIIDYLKEKKSSNIDDISIVEKYETDLVEFSTVDNVVENLYRKGETKEKKDSQIAANTAKDKFKISYGLSYEKANIGISLIRPVTGSITSRFGSYSRRRNSAHTGLDISASRGTPIKAAASGTVVYAGWRGGYGGGYGNLVAISHGNNVQTFYGHCSKIYVSVGKFVSQGDVIAAVGSTGNSTGSHLHFEVRVNGVAYNPQKYIY